LHERIESIGFSSWPLAIRAARVPQPTDNFKSKVVIHPLLRKIVICFAGTLQICSAAFGHINGR
ncbi:MAG TPA: hypothetical protein VMF32_03350, partial [Xanthobacteraceae bacterium]|nr:hypothetical protein [Xanthobacteraceae bacterium]